MGVKFIFMIEKKRRDGVWIPASQTYCDPGDARQLIHSVAFDDTTRVRRRAKLAPGRLPRYNFCPPGTMTKLK